MKHKTYGKAELSVLPTREEMGTAVARDAAEVLRGLLAEKPEVNCIFAAAPSQNEFLQALQDQPGIEWERVNAFHMDEYIGLPIGDEHSFNQFLTGAIFSRLPFKSVNLINGAAQPEAECKRYAALLAQNPTDIVFMGIGENGHLAFNDPPVADFNDPATVKTVELDRACRMQQVHDGCFAALEEVPTHAITLTIPALLAGRVFCVVPGARKAKALAAALTGMVSTGCPASILQKQEGARVYADSASAAGLAI